MREKKRMLTGLKLRHEAVRKRARQEPRKNIGLRSSGEQDRSRIGAAASSSAHGRPSSQSSEGQEIA